MDSTWTAPLTSRALTIAYDLRYASDHFTGIGTHAFCLLEAMVALPGDERFVVLWNPALPSTRFDHRALRAHHRIRWVETPARPLHPLDLARLGRGVRALE